MINPFSFSGTVADQGFCNRKQEQKDIIDFIQNSENVLLHANRRMGKTSLIYKVFCRLDNDITKLYIDLYGTVSENDFIEALMKNAGQLESRSEKLLKTAKEIFTSSNVSLSIDPVTNLPSLTPVFGSSKNSMLLENAMLLLERYSGKKRMVIVFDEFQEIENYSGGEFEKRLRGFIQKHNRISYIFAGSRQHILASMFNSKGKAFYKLAHSYPLSEIEEDDYIKWIKGLFADKKKISDKLIIKVVNICERHPMYIQQFFYHLWEADLKSPEIIDQTLDLILLRNRNEYMNIWDSLTLNQRKTLKLIAANEGKDLYSADSLKSVSLTTPSQVTKTLQSLTQKDIIQKNGVYKIQDIMFKQWILRL
ncbi:MAG: ATP-binding protein [Spirochaetes bacterium]|nr:ATP-binding protein [Spirochaetota bacterium]MBN2769361.1 ATP-binding protein [Spirochaetota bacterium]